MEHIKAELLLIVEADKPMTVRQVFYRAVVAGLVEKTEGEYQNTVARLLVDMRRSGDLPYHWMSDNTRWMRRPAMYSGLADFIARHQRAYRRDLWAKSPTYIEIWCEKEALAGVITRRDRRVRRAAHGEPRLRLRELSVLGGRSDHRSIV